jgi:hypothetical protein
VKERRVGIAAGLGKRAHGEGVHGESRLRVVLGRLDPEGRGIHDRLRPELSDAIEHLLALGHIQRGARHGGHFVASAAQLARENLPELASSARDDDSHRYT